MTKFRSSAAAILGCAVLAGCATSSGEPAARVAEPGIAAAYLPLHGRIHLGLDSADGAAMVVAPGIAATNAHNSNLVDPKSVIGTVHDYDLMFFRTRRGTPPATAPVALGLPVTAYGQGGDADLRIAHGVVREIQKCPGCTAPAYFVFTNPARGDDDAGPGFSGGPVLDASGRLVGITFGYKDSGHQRLIYAYDMSRVRAELSAFQKAPN
jgi:hypothetical protein